MNRSRFQIAKNDIIATFEKSQKGVFTYGDISRILQENQQFWRLPISLTTEKFIEQLISHTKLKKYRLSFPYRTIVRFSWGDLSAFGLALNLEENAYFTHYTAMFLHNLTEQIPKTIYVNHEQREKRVGDSALLQSNIDRAFVKRDRVTSSIAQFGEHKICLLNGKFTNRLGVIEMTTPENEKVMVTDIERTLIDITVRPSYSGGIYEVLEAYRRAVDKVSVNKLAAMLKKLGYIYPHHQAIGFYLEKAGVYSESQIQLLRKLDMKHDFYLMHEMKDKQYSKEWKLYYPRGF